MKVSELIQILSIINPDADVKINSWNGESNDPVVKELSLDHVWNYSEDGGYILLDSDE